MPNVGSYAYTSATGRRWQQLAQEADLRNFCTFTDSWLDGGTDITSVLNTAMTNRRASALNSLHRPLLILPTGFYKQNDNIDCHGVALWAPGGAIFLAQSVGTGKAALKWTEASETRWPAWAPPCAKNIAIYGRDTPAGGATYTAGASAIQTGLPYARFEDILIGNFDKPVMYGSYDYNHVWDRLHVQNGNYGLYWPKLQSVSGERMIWNDCNFSNNNVGFYINHNTDSNADGIGDAAAGGGSFFLRGCAIDYNITEHGRVIGPGSAQGDILSNVVLDDCHLETLIATSGSANRITNGAVLEIDASTFYDDYAVPITTSFYGRTSLVPAHFQIGGNNIWCVGNGGYRSAGTTQRYGGDVWITSTVTDFVNEQKAGRVINSQSAAYTLVRGDEQKTILHPSADTTARTWTIPANSSVPFPIGTEVHFVNQNGGGVITIAITTDTMRLSTGGTTGNRSLAANGIAIARKITSTEWIISGSGLT